MKVSIVAIAVAASVGSTVAAIVTVEVERRAIDDRTSMPLTREELLIVDELVAHNAEVTLDRAIKRACEYVQWRRTKQ